MGLSSSKSSTKQSGTQQGTTITSGTTMPVTPQPLQDSAYDYIDRIREFGNLDPRSLVAGPSALQQQAFQTAQGLGGGGGGYGAAQAMATAAGNAPANLAGPAASYTAPTLGSAQGYTGQGYSAPTIGAAQGYSAAQLGPAQGYSAASAGPASQAQFASLLENLGSYMSPYTNDVVSATLADFDHGGQQQQARLAAQGAKSGAFGGSRFGIAEAELAGNLARDRAVTSANLRDAAFRTGAGLSATDAAARQAASMFNTGEQNRFALDLAGRTDAASQFGANWANQFGLDQAARTDAASQFGANAGNQFRLTQFGADTDAARYGADAANRASEFNATNDNAFRQLQAQLQAQAGQFNAGSANDMARFNAAQGDTAQARALVAAQLMASIAGNQGSDDRANLALQAQLGEQQRGIEQQQALAPLAQLEAIGQLSGMTPYDILVGRSVNGTENMTGSYSGTSTTKQSPSLFNQLLAGGSLFL